MRKYDHLFFDLDNTLWDFTANSREAMIHTLRELDLFDRIHFDDFFKLYEQINETLWSDYRAKKITKQALIVERFSRSLEAFQITGQDWVEINRLYLEKMAQQTQLFPDTIKTLSYLKAKGYQMHIITNGFKEVQHAKLTNCGLSGFFHKVFISEEIKTTKPHREIFEHALKTVNASKKKSIMIGDSWETDIEGALAFGLDQIMFLNDGGHTIPTEIKSTLEASATPCLSLKPLLKTWFIHKINDLITIL